VFGAVLYRGQNTDRFHRFCTPNTLGIARFNGQIGVFWGLNSRFDRFGGLRNVRDPGHPDRYVAHWFGVLVETSMVATDSELVTSSMSVLGSH
jgi:hypothetical protein